MDLRPLELSGRNDACGLSRIADTKLDLNKTVLAKTRTDRQRDAGMDDLEMGHLDTLAAACNLEPSRLRGRAQLSAKRCAGLGGRNDDDGSLNLKHRNPQ
jgi:outer membrane scaffolding protein for murein synthesis (MipA/OmpV family)